MDREKIATTYKSKRTVSRKRKKFSEDYYSVFGKLPQDDKIPTYKLDKEANSDSGQGKPTAGSSATVSGAVAFSSQEQTTEESNDDGNFNTDAISPITGNNSNDDNVQTVVDRNRGDNSSNDDSDIDDLHECHVDDDASSDDGDSDGISVTTDYEEMCNIDIDENRDGDGGGDGDDDGNGSDDGDDGDDEDFSAYFVIEGPVITMRPNVHEHEIIIAVMALAQRHAFSFEAMLGVIGLFKEFANYNTLPTTKTALWKKLGKNENNSQTRYLYCKTCKAVTGTGKIPDADCPCGYSGPEKPLSMYRNNRRKIDPDGIEYLFDGEQYKKLRTDEEFLNSNLNFSLTMNTDGCQVAVSSKESAWPVLLSINELPPHARKRYVILAAIWVDKEHPNFNIFMPPIIEELHELYFTGIDWRPDGTERVTSKFITTICTTDTPARAKLLNTTSYNGEFGCNFCYVPGVPMENRSRKYPIENIVNRTDAEIRHDMTEAMDTEIRQRGFIGDSTLKYVPEFDLRWGIVVDSMHCVDLGVVKKLTQMIVFGKMTDAWFRASARILRIIEGRLKTIRTPSGIARKPRPLKLWKMWKSTEWRNWLLYYCVPCLTGLIPDQMLRLFIMLSEAIHILNSDTFTAQQLQRARELINDFESEYEVIFGIDNMTTNMTIYQNVL